MKSKAEIEHLVNKYMKSLGISREEALQVIADDEAIDRGEKLFELDPELEKGAKKARRGDRKPNSTPTKREKKADHDKAELIATIEKAIKELNGVTSLEVTNSEREMIFFYNDRKFKIVLSAPRT